MQVYESCQKERPNKHCYTNIKCTQPQGVGNLNNKQYITVLGSLQYLEHKFTEEIY